MTQPPRFYILDLAYTHWTVGLTIVALSNTPCHLTCRWSTNLPIRHRTSRELRGETLPWGAYWCFTAWHDLEQEEPGDTLYHTFPFPTWPPPQTRWFTFIGTLLTEPSPSSAPIINHTHTGADNLNPIIRPNAPGFYCQPDIDGTGPPCPNHYQTINTPPPPGDLTYLQPATDVEWLRLDSYNLPNIRPGTFSGITHTYRHRADGYWIAVPPTGLLLRLDGQNEWGMYENSTTEWQYYSRYYPVDPWDFQPWTYQKINRLEAGVILTYRSSPTKWVSPQVSEVYLTIHRLLYYPSEPAFPPP